MHLCHKNFALKNFHFFRFADYQYIFDELATAGAITITKKNKISLTTPIGVEMLMGSLTSDNFQFNNNSIGTWVANALVTFITKNYTPSTTTTSEVTANIAPQPEVINSYDQFKTVALEVYDQLNYEYNFRDLVPIYRIRRTIGERVSRSQFNDYLLAMQADELLQLQEGSVEDSALDKIEDSVSTELDGLRCFASRIES